MNYWITTHWPARIGEDDSVEAAGVWVPDGRQAVAADMRKGDLIIVYEMKTGRTELRTMHDGSVRRIPRKKGREGVICYGEVDSPIAAIPGSQAQKYSDGTEVWWRWFAPVSLLSRTGFVSRREVVRILGFSSGYVMRGFGGHHSGVKKVTESVFNTIVTAFHASRPIELPAAEVVGSGGHGGSGEGQVHMNLKKYVAAAPSKALNESGLRTLETEYKFPTNDRADIVLVDRYERIVGVEIEPTVSDLELAGTLQAIKYRHMLECVTKRERGDSRGILVAHSISRGAQNVCARYGIECKEVSQAAVDAWLATNS